MAVSAGPSERNQAIESQIRSWLRLADFEGLEQNDIARVREQIDWQSEIDSSLSASANYERIKAKYGLRTKGDTERYHQKNRDRMKQHAAREVRSQIKEYGPQRVAQAVRYGYGPDPLLSRVNDILEHYEPEFYDPYLGEVSVETPAEPIEAAEPEEPDDSGSETPELASPGLGAFLEGLEESASGGVTETTLRDFAGSLAENKETTETVKKTLTDFFRYLTEPVHDGNGNPIGEDAEGKDDW